MAKHFKKVSELPEPVSVAPVRTETVFTDDLVEALKDNPGSWYHVETATAVGAAAWRRRVNGTFKGNDGKDKANDTPFQVKSINTGKTTKDKNNKDRAKPDVFVSYNP